MAGMDYGVIAIKNGKFMLPMSEMGAACSLDIGGVTFYKYLALSSNSNKLVSHKTYVFTPMTFFTNNKYGKLQQFIYGFTQEPSLRLKWVDIATGELNFKVKLVGKGIYEYRFTYEGDNYNILAGADVDFKYFHHPITKKIVTKFLNRNLTTKKGD